MPTRRQSRVGDLIREVLSELMLHEMRDPRLAQIISITRVDVSQDLANARVHVSILGTDEEKVQTLKGLQAGASFLRNGLRGRAELRRIPFLAFVLDESIEGGARILALMKQEAASQRSGGTRSARRVAPERRSKRRE